MTQPRNFWRDTFFSERIWWMRHCAGVTPPALPVEADCPSCLRNFISNEDRNRIVDKIDTSILINRIVEDCCVVSVPSHPTAATSVRIGDLERILRLHLHKQEPNDD